MTWPLPPPPFNGLAIIGGTFFCGFPKGSRKKILLSMAGPLKKILLSMAGPLRKNELFLEPFFPTFPNFQRPLGSRGGVGLGLNGPAIKRRTSLTITCQPKKIKNGKGCKGERNLWNLLTYQGLL